jgi:hypothetical protein
MKPSIPLRPLVLLTLVAALLSGCNGTDSGTDSQPTRGEVTTLDQVAPGADITDNETLTALELSPLPDLPSYDLPPPTGDKELGEECLQDGDCLSGICFAGKNASGCTIACTRQTDCQQFGLICVPQRPDLATCVPPPPVQLPCADHDSCLYPTTCVAQYGWCDLPECTLDGDCPPGQECEPGTRQCQPTTCQSTYECASPVDFCLDGTCGPPECTVRSDCPEGQICSYAQGICDEALPCNEEGACNWYNQMCVDGLCEPNLCATPCANEAHVCHPKTGKCGAACNAPSSCPQGWNCDVAAGVCYENLAPVAVPLVLSASGPMIELSGSQSMDPEGLPLTYRWMLLSVPPLGSQETGTVFCQQETCQLGPIAPGVTAIGLWVQDQAGAWSPQSQVTVFSD